MAAVCAENPLESPFKDIKYDLAQNILMMEKHLTLERMALIRVAISLWHKEDLERAVEPSDTREYKRLKTNLSSDNILKRVSQLSIQIFCENELKEMIKSVGRELFKFFISQSPCDNVNYKMDISWKKKIDIYWGNIHWTQQGTINMAKTVSSIIENADLTIIEKYRLACDYCLERHITDLHGQVPRDDIVKISGDYDFRLVLTWHLHVSGDSSKFNDSNLLKWVIHKGNGVAVQYIWENHASEDVKKNIIHFGILAMLRDYNDISLYLLTVMDESQVQELCKGTAEKLLAIPFLDWRCKQLLFGTAKYVVSLLAPLDTRRTSKFVSFCYAQNLLNKYQYLSILQTFFSSLNDVTEEMFREIFSCGFDSISSLNAIEILKLLVNKVSYDIKKQFLFSDGVGCVMDLIVSSSFHFLDLFIKEMLHYKNEDVEEFKEIIKSKTKYICSSQAMTDNYELLDKYFEMFYGEEILTVKPQLPYKDNYEIVHLMKRNTRSYNSQKELAEKIGKFSSWCFDGNENEMNKFNRNFKKRRRRNFLNKWKFFK